MPLRLAALISGSGSTLQNFLACRERGELEIDVPLVIADRECSGIERARSRGLTVELWNRKHDSPAVWSTRLFERVRAAEIDLVCLAGFLSRIAIPDDFSHRVMNIHPSLIPAFCGPGMYGQHVHEAVIARGCKISGCTVHLADNEYDHGPILVQKCVPVEPHDTPATLAARVFAAERIAYPEAIRHFAAEWRRV